MKSKKNKKQKHNYLWLAVSFPLLWSAMILAQELYFTEDGYKIVYSYRDIFGKDWTNIGKGVVTAQSVYEIDKPRIPTYKVSFKSFPSKEIPTPLSGDCYVRGEQVPSIEMCFDRRYKIGTVVDIVIYKNDRNILKIYGTDISPMSPGAIIGIILFPLSFGIVFYLFVTYNPCVLVQEICKLSLSRSFVNRFQR